MEQNEEISADGGDDQQKAENAQGGHAPLVANAATPQRESNSPAKPESSNVKLIEPFWDLKFSSLSQAVFSIALIAVGSLQYCVYKQQRELMQAQQRARLTYTNPDMRPYDASRSDVASDSPEISAWWVSPGWKNVGSTAAMHFKMGYSKLDIQPRNGQVDINNLAKQCPEVIHDAPSDFQGSTLAQGEGRIAPANELPFDVAQRAQDGLYTIMFTVDATYEEVSGTPHKALACVWINVLNAKRSKFSLLTVRETGD